MPRIESLLITGCNGFVGKSILDYLITLPPDERPKRLGLVSRNEIPKMPKNLLESTKISNIQADLAKPWIFNFSASHIIHLAADGSPTSYSTESGMNFMQIVKNLCAWLGTQEFPIVFHASSGAAFGHVPLLKSHLEKRRTRLGFESKIISKASFIQFRKDAENELLRVAQSGMCDLRIGRLYSFIGNHMYGKSQYAVPAFVNMALNSGTIKLAGDPHTVRSYLSAEEMSNWILNSLNLDIGSEILSIGSEKAVTLQDVAKYIAKLTDANVDLPQAYNSGDYYVANNEATIRRLQVKEAAPWETSIRKYLAYAREVRLNEKG